jgi:hypothetical protein
MIKITQKINGDNNLNTKGAECRENNTRDIPI